MVCASALADVDCASALADFARTLTLTRCCLYQFLLMLFVLALADVACAPALADVAHVLALADVIGALAFAVVYRTFPILFHRFYGPFYKVGPERFR